jgi:hypothetical protein
MAQPSRARARGVSLACASYGASTFCCDANILPAAATRGRHRFVAGMTHIVFVTLTAHRTVECALPDSGVGECLSGHCKARGHFLVSHRTLDYYLITRVRGHTKLVELAASRRISAECARASRCRACQNLGQLLQLGHRLRSSNHAAGSTQDPRTRCSRGAEDCVRDSCSSSQGPDHNRAAYCHKCQRRPALDLAPLIEQGRGGYMFVGRRPRCSDCGEHGQWQLRPPVYHETKASCSNVGYRW